MLCLRKYTHNRTKEKTAFPGISLEVGWRHAGGQLTARRGGQLAARRGERLGLFLCSPTCWSMAERTNRPHFVLHRVLASRPACRSPYSPRALFVIMFGTDCLRDDMGRNEKSLGERLGIQPESLVQLCGQMTLVIG